MRFALAFALLALAAGPAAAGCIVPKDLAPAPAYAPPANEVQADVQIAFYLLAITWTPEWRRINGQTPATTPTLDEARRPQGFALHGLWPNGKAPPYPRYCRPVGPIDAATVRRMYCRTPSAALLQHEWEAHGSCSWTDPKAYFAQAAKLYDAVKLPRIEDRAGLTAGQLRQALVAGNPWLSPAAVFVAADKERRLTEVRLCYDLAYKPAVCPGGNGAPDDLALSLTRSGGRRF